MANKVALTEVDDIAIVTMDNGGQMNTIDIALCRGLLGTLDEIVGRNKHRVVILRASGKGFSAGGDLVQMSAALERSDNGYLDELITQFHATILAIRRLSLPVIGSVHGAAAGAGFSLALACDITIAASNARFIAGYPKIGTSTDGGLSFQLTRRLGPARAIDVLLHRDALTAEEALYLGLVQDICELDSLDSAAIALAKEVAKHPSKGVAEIKGLVSRLADDGLDAHLEQEKQAFIRCPETNEFRDNIAQFARQSSMRKV